MGEAAEKHSWKETDCWRRSLVLLSTYALIRLDILALSTVPARTDSWGMSVIDLRRITYV
jgi:hypothetical protein